MQAPQVSYQSVPVPNQIQRKTFSYDRGKKTKSLPYIPSGSFAKSKLIEGADANASVTGNESTVPMSLRIIGHVEMPNSKTYDLTGCFVGLEAWGTYRVSAPSFAPAISAVSKATKLSTNPFRVMCPLWAKTA